MSSVKVAKSERKFGDFAFVFRYIESLPVTPPFWGPRQRLGHFGPAVRIEGPARPEEIMGSKTAFALGRYSTNL